MQRLKAVIETEQMSLRASVREQEDAWRDTKTDLFTVCASFALSFLFE